MDSVSNDSGSISTYSISDYRDIDSFRFKLAHLDESKLTNQFLLYNLTRTMMILNEVSDDELLDDKVYYLLPLVTNLSYYVRSETLLKEISKLDVHSTFKRIIKYYLKDEYYTQHDYKCKNMSSIFGALMNFTDLSEEFAKQNVKHDFIELSLKCLDKGHFLSEIELNSEKSFDLYDAIITFLLTNAEYRSIKDEINDTNIVQMLLEHKKRIDNIVSHHHKSKELKIVKANILTILAYILENVDLEALNVLEDVASSIVILLAETIKKSKKNDEDKFDTKFYISTVINHVERNMFASDVMDTLLKLCVDNKIKQKVFNCQALPPILVLLEEGNESEQYYSAELLCSLAFLEQVRKYIKEDKSAMKLINSKAKSDPNISIRTTCKQIVDMVNKTIENRLLSLSTNHDTRNIESLVMINYAPANLDICRKLNNELQKRGYKTWIDIENSFKDINDATLGAIDSSSVVLICFSEDYYLSNSCRIQSQYAVDQQKQVIAVQIQDRFKANGWLDSILNGKLYVDVSSENDDIVNLDYLCKQIEYSIRAKNSEQASGKNKLTKKDLIKKWSSEQVGTWLMSQDLNEIATALKQYNGMALLSLYEMKQKNYDRFCSTIDKELELLNENVPFHKKLLFYQLIEDLFND